MADLHLNGGFSLFASLFSDALVTFPCKTNCALIFFVIQLRLDTSGLHEIHIKKTEALLSKQWGGFFMAVEKRHSFLKGVFVK